VGLIEQAAKRLEELKRAGVEVPMAREADAVGQHSPSGVLSTPERLIAAQANAPGLFRGDGRREAAVNGAAVHSATVAEPRRSKLIEIDLQKLAGAGYVTPTASRSQLADELRVIKRPLIANAQGKSASPISMANLIMITSSVPGEGKTFMAINLAVSIAMELDTTVLLVDADVARPAVPGRLGIPQEKGLLDLLTNKDLDVADVMLRTNIDRLSLLPAGTPHSRATELLASESMARLVEEMAGRYPERILVFDAPPLLPSTESRVLATHMGQVVVVVEADRTPQSTVTQALATIESCPVVMTVLNKVPHSKLGSYYGFYGSYGSYGYGH
jgi:exopolysaccharide/PEP-CTERM locus tyrosine autokinase